MKIISWNINGYRSVTGQNPSRRFDVVTKDNKLFKYIEQEQPDIVCLQEIKADTNQIDEALLQPEGYHSFYNTCRTKKGYSGVAIFTKEKPLEVIYDLGRSKFDDEGRILLAHYKDFSVFGIYFPKGYADNDRLDYKLEFYECLFDYISKNKRPYIISGDYNTAHKPIDLARPAENIGTSGFMPIERVKLDWMVENGFVDTFREFHEDNGHYTWWTQRGRARENNVGWRIDYHFITSDLKKSLKSAYHHPDQQGSDHCPVIAELDL
jgi:exodeoxyribonuclease-3